MHITNTRVADVCHLSTDLSCFCAQRLVRWFTLQKSPFWLPQVYIIPPSHKMEEEYSNQRNKWGLKTACYLYIVWSNLGGELSGKTWPCFSICFANHPLKLAFPSLPPRFIPGDPMHIHAFEGLCFGRNKEKQGFCFLLTNWALCLFWTFRHNLQRVGSNRLIWRTLNKENHVTNSI